MVERPRPNEPHLISPWYMRAVVVLSVVLVLTAFAAGYALRQATSAADQAAHAACLGANESKVAVRSLVDTLVARATAPAPNETPTDKARRELSAKAYLDFKADSDRLLSEKAC